MSNSVRPHRQQPTRLPHPWDSPGKNTGVGCHFLLQCVKVKSESEVAQSCPTLSDPMDCSPPGSSVHRILQARVLEWGAIAFSTKQHKYMQLSGTQTRSQGRTTKACGAPQIVSLAKLQVYWNEDRWVQRLTAPLYFEHLENTELAIKALERETR